MIAVEYFDQFIEDKKDRYSKLTLESYSADLKQFFEFVGNDLENLKRKNISDFIAHVLSQTNKFSGKPYRPQTVNKKLVALRQYIDWINANTELKIHIEINLLEIQKQEYLSADLLSIAEFERIIAATQEDGIFGIQARAILYGLYYTGMRISELLQMKVSDVEKLELWIKGKGGKYREIPIADKLKPTLQEYIKAKVLTADDYVYVNLAGKKPMSRQTAHKIFKKYGGKAKVKLKKVHLHNLRHLFCMTMLEKGATLEEVADLAGHSNINTTRIYVRKTKAELRSTVEKL